ncbi:hypothetical protein [Parapedomonas caeni]|jgi:AcrR family transcriptional regulator
MSSKTHPTRHECLDAFLALIAETGWPAASVAAVAARLGVSPAVVLETAGDRFEMLAAVGRRADAAALKAADDAGGSMGVRDRLFELLMARFDALARHRPAIRALMRAARRDPALAAFFATRLPRSLALLAETAGVGTMGVAGMARVAALGGLYLKVVRTWLDDDSEDMGTTMAALEKALARAEQWADRCRPLRRSAPAAPDAPSAADPGPVGTPIGI